MTDYRALCAELFKACETLYKQSVTASHHQTITLSNGEHPIPISSGMLAQDAVFGDLLHRTRAALAEQQGEGPSEYEWKDIGDGRPVQVQRCHKCGVCPSNVDDCGHFGDSRCPYFGIDALAAPSAPEPVGEGPSDKELNILWNCSGIADEHGNHTGNIFEFARAVLARWGHQPTPQPLSPSAQAADDSTLRDAALLALTTLEGWSNYDQWVWPISAMEQVRRGTTEAIASLRMALSRFAPPAEGEVAELVARLRTYANVEQAEGRPAIGRSLSRAAELLQQQHPTPVPVSERLPEPNVKVLAYYFNALGNGRTICAIWVPAKSRSDDVGGDDDFTEYDEEDDKFYWPEGWYEVIENWDDLGWVAVNEGEVAYWQPLPKWPALPLPQGEVE